MATPLVPTPVFPSSPVYHAADFQTARRKKIETTDADLPELPSWLRYWGNIGRSIFSAGGCTSTSEVNACTPPQAISPAGLIARHPALNENGDIVFDGAMVERGARQVYVVYDGYDGRQPPSHLSFDGDNHDPFIDNKGDILYLSGSDNGATVRFFDGGDHDQRITVQQNCFFPEMSSDNAWGIYVCNVWGQGTTYFLQNLGTQETQPLNPPGIAVDRSAISRDGNLIALSTRWPHDRDDTNGLAWDIYLQNLQQNTIERVSFDSAGLQRNTPSKNPCLFDNSKGLKLLSYVTISATGNQMVVIYDVVRKKVLKEIETDRLASLAGDVDIEPYLAGDQGELVLISYADGLYLQNWKSPRSSKKLIDHEATQGTMNKNGRIAFVKKENGKERVSVTDVCNYF